LGGVVEPDFVWVGGAVKQLTVSGSIDLYSVLHLIPQAAPPLSVSDAGYIYVSGSVSSGSLMYYDGASWKRISLQPA